MTLTQQRLYEKLSAFQIDGGGEALSFAGRLARENGWSLSFSRRVIAEYLRFVFLCCEAGHPCTPSDQVDQAWHLHLTYTRSYWDEMCGKLLPRPNHHNPTKGGKQEDAKFDDWYARTLDAYRLFFGSNPPADIWPGAAERFGVDPYARRVNLKRFWVIPKGPVRRCGAYLGIAAGTAALAGCSSQVSGDPYAALFVILGVAAVIGLIIAFAQARKRSGPSGGAWGSGCSTADGGGPWSGGTGDLAGHGGHGHGDLGGHGGHDGGGHGDAGGHGSSDGSGSDGGSGCGGGGCSG